jgi:hypothetical protein
LGYLGFAEKVVCEEREQGTGNREQGTLRPFDTLRASQAQCIAGNSFSYLDTLNFSYPIRSDKEKCNCFETPFAKTLHLLVLKTRETPIK